MNSCLFVVICLVILLIMWYVFCVWLLYVWEVLSFGVLLLMRWFLWFVLVIVFRYWVSLVIWLWGWLRCCLILIIWLMWDCFILFLLLYDFSLELFDGLDFLVFKWRFGIIWKIVNVLSVCLNVVCFGSWFGLLWLSSFRFLWMNCVL